MDERPVSRSSALDTGSRREITSPFPFILRLIGIPADRRRLRRFVVDGCAHRCRRNPYAPLGQSCFSDAGPVTHAGTGGTRHIHPALWDPVLLTILLWPAALVAFVLRLLLLWLAAKTRRPIVISREINRA